MLELRDMLHLDCLTVTGKTLGENLEEVERSKFFMRERLGYLKNFRIDRDEIIRPRDDPFGTDGGVAILRGNIAPEGAMGEDVLGTQGDARAHGPGQGLRGRARRD